MERKEDINLFFENGEVLFDYTPNVLSWMIFSDRAISIFKELRIKQFQAFPVEIINKHKKYKTYKSNVINITCEYSVLNWEKSDIITWEDDPKYIKAIRNLVMDKSNLDKEIDIFRLTESKNYIIVSERFKNKVIEKGLSGFGFWEIE